MLWLCLALAVITLAVFGQTAHFPFVNFDDNEYVSDNPVVTGGLNIKGIAWVFSHPDCNFYHPLTMLSLMADYQLHGLHAGGYHLTNVLLHTASVVLLFLALRAMTGALWQSAFVAAVFAIHPLRAESVAWVAERKDVLGVFFLILTLGAYVHYVRKPNPARYLMMAAIFVLSLLAKPVGMTLPFVLLLLDYWPLRRTELRKLSGLIMEKLPLLVLSITAGVVTIVAEGKAVATVEQISVSSRIDNVLVSYAIYLREMFWPAGLAPFHPHPDGGYPLWATALSLLVLALITVGVLVCGRKRRWLLTGWFWYLVVLAPMIGIVQVGAFAHADRMTYLPQIGICIGITWLTAELKLGRAVFGGLMAVVIGTLMVCCWRQTAYWRNSETLWTHTLACTTRNYVAHGSLGNALLDDGRVADAIAQFQETLKIKPDEVLAHYNLANALVKNKNMADAIAQYQMTLQLQPDYPAARGNLGKALMQLGKMDEAMAQFQELLRTHPDDAKAHFNLGNVLLQKGRLDEAIDHFHKALEIKPDDADAHEGLGNALLQKGSMAEALKELQTALQLEPANPSFQNNLAWFLATCLQPPFRDGAKAVDLARQANESSDGKNPVFLDTMAAAYAEIGRFSDAVATERRALSLVESLDTNLAESFRFELKLYQAGRPYHSPESPSK